MAYKPIGIDENGQLPTRARAALSKMFVTQPLNIQDGQVPIWNSATQTWISGSPGTGGGTPTKIDGGSPSTTPN